MRTGLRELSSHSDNCPTANSSAFHRLIISLLATRDVAQVGSALRLGRRGRRFESDHPDQTGSNTYTSRGVAGATGSATGS
jgi:hypothetical protein